MTRPSRAENVVDVEWTHCPSIAFRGGARRRAPRPNETFVVPALILTVLTRSAAPRRPPPRRFVPQKLYLSSAHAKAIPGTCSPGPASAPRGSLGHQPLSHCPDAPATSFPRLDRSILGDTPGGAHVHHPNSKPPELRSPGPGAYDAPSSVGSQPLSAKKSRPAHTISPTTREQAQAVYSGRSSEANYLGRDTPAPTAYDLPCTATGRQSDASKTSSPTARFTTAERFKTPSEGRGFVRPGPGAHELKGAASVGRQTLSTTASAPTLRCAMGKSTRESRERIYLSRAHEKDAYGRFGPGPVSPNATLRSSLGRQPSSRARDEPSPSFTKSGRWGFADRRAEEPGPGTYNC